MIFTALITPFRQDGSLDEEGLSTLLQRQPAGVIVLGTTGEAPTLSDEEKESVMRISRQSLNNQQLVVGTGTNSTVATIAATQKAAALGADGVLLVCPYYNRPTQEGLFRHFEAVAKASTIPIFLYNHPKRTGVRLETETLVRLAQIPSIIGVKDSSAEMQQTAESLMAVKSAREDFLFLAGDDALTLPLMALGGDGVVSVSGNLAPQAMGELVKACANGDYAKARALHRELSPLFAASCLETNPVPIKEALSIAGHPAGKPRLPLSPLSDQNRATLKEILQRCHAFQ